jgi:hypothetical protein
MGSVESSLSIDARPHFLQALRRVLRPIIRLMIRSGIRYDEFIDVARGAYVESAIRDGIGTTANPTREQIAWATGIDRQRVDHYIDDDGALPAARVTMNRVVIEVLHKWHTDPKYLDTQGTPVELDLTETGTHGFGSLVAEINPEVDPASVLERLLQAKTVVYSSENQLRTVTRFFIRQGDDEGSIEHFGEAIAHLIETHVYNFDPKSTNSKRLDRAVFPDHGLPMRLLKPFQACVRERAEQFLLDVDDWLARNSDRMPRKTSKEVRAGVNVFFYVDPEPDSRSLSSLVRPRQKGELAERAQGES